MRKVVSESIGSPKRRHEIATKAIMNGWASTPAGSIMFAAQNQAQSAMQATLGAELAKDVTLTSPLSTGFVPFDLRQPSRLLYPVYSPLRNRIARTQAQGTSLRLKVITGVSGSQSSSAGILDWSFTELNGAGSISSTYPITLPQSGTQTAVDLNIP